MSSPRQTSAAAANASTAKNSSSINSRNDEFKYERIRKIGIGSYGIVYKCIHKPTNQVVAIKRYSESDADPNMRKIAIREVRILRQLRHPNIINLIEVFRKRRRLHLVFDFCDLTVLDVIEKYAEDCPLKLIKRITWQLVNAVNYCHLKNCIHRDIKPENILINQAGVVKLCDFGFARNMPNKTNGNYQLTPTHKVLASNQRNNCMNSINSKKGSSTSEVEMSVNMTNANRRYSDQQQSQQYHIGMSTTPGGGCSNQSASDRDALTEYVATRWYRAPELLIGDSHYDTKIDIWAIGCVMAELSCGEPVWPGKTDLDQLSLIQRSLGPLTPKQARVLSCQINYDRSTIERLLHDKHSHLNESDKLESKIPTRLGRFGADFVLSCLRIDPDDRPNSLELLIHPFIHRARIEQFIVPIANLYQQQRKSSETNGSSGSKVGTVEISTGNASNLSPPSRRRWSSGNDENTTSRANNRSNNNNLHYFASENDHQKRRASDESSYVMVPDSNNEPTSNNNDKVTYGNSSRSNNIAGGALYNNNAGNKDNDSSKNEPIYMKQNANRNHVASKSMIPIPSLTNINNNHVKTVQPSSNHGSSRKPSNNNATRNQLQLQSSPRVRTDFSSKSTISSQLKEPQQQQPQSISNSDRSRKNQELPILNYNNTRIRVTPSKRRSDQVGSITPINIAGRRK